MPRPLRPTPLPTPPSEAAMARDLSAAQAQEMFEQEQLPSPLELEPKSYTEVPEYAKQRTKERQMVEAGERFVGAPIVPTVGRPTGGPAPEEAGPTSSKRRRRMRGEESEEYDESQDETEDPAILAAALQAEQDMERRRAQQEAEKRQKEAEAEQRKAFVKRMLKKQMRAYVLRALAVLGPCAFYASLVVLGFIIQVIFMMMWFSKAAEVFDAISPWFS
ncbi:hypothetical protein L0Y59_03450 [Candidatus Uhrbacteria bacterium]|nr:hypothetical protein [Candidatus Uhrbacteria bacterium]